VGFLVGFMGFKKKNGWFFWVGLFENNPVNDPSSSRRRTLYRASQPL